MLEEAQELPGMLAVAYATIRQEWPHCVDATVWVAKFREYNPECNVPDDVMLGWFGNSIMAGYDTARMHAGTWPSQPPAPEADSK